MRQKLDTIGDCEHVFSCWFLDNILFHACTQLYCPRNEHKMCYL